MTINARIDDLQAMLAASFNWPLERRLAVLHEILEATLELIRLQANEG